jgi:hypothetical protein
VVSELEEYEGGTLVSGQPADVLEQFCELLLELELICRTEQRRAIDEFEVAGHRPMARADLGKATVASDGVKPRAQANASVSTSEGPVCRDEGQLNGVLGFLPASERAGTEGEHAATMTIVDSRKSSVVTCSHLSDQIGIRHARQRPPIYHRRFADDRCDSFHRQSMGHRLARV